MEPMPEFRQSFWANTKTLTRRKHQTMIQLLSQRLGSQQRSPDRVMPFWSLEYRRPVHIHWTGYQCKEGNHVTRRTLLTYVTQEEASSYAIANSVALVPQAIFESVVFGSLVYWLTGFVVHAGHYFVFIVLLVLTNLNCKDTIISKAHVDVHYRRIRSFWWLCSVKKVIPDCLSWVYWLNPMAWCLRALDVNEYRAAEYDVCIFKGVDYCSEFNATMGEYFLAEFSVPSASEWVWTGVVYLIVAYLFFMTLGAFVLEFKRYDGPRNVVLTPKNIEKSKSTENSYALVSTPKNSDVSPGSSSLSVDSVVDVPREKYFVPVTLAFQDLWYSVPKPNNPKESITLLKGISGFARPGTLTALMGSSGAGKTTLMDVIAGRKTGGEITGKILLNGYEANELAIRRCTAYCEQMDIHSDATTFREAFTFSAFLRQDSSVSDSKKFDTVAEVLDLLDMHDIADQIVRGSSMEQMKRLTIGVELAAQPSVLFLDEPTSGLDAHSSKLIMDGVRKVADSGRTIVCTIHQPSSDVFFLFDHLLLLKRGGESVFVGELGEKSRNLVNYLEAIPGTPLLPEGQNPATWMLEVIGAGVSNNVTTDFVQYFNDSAEKRTLAAAMEMPGVNYPALDVPEMIFTKKRAANSMTQLWFLMKRFNDRYWRTPTYNITRFAISLMLAIVFGLVFMGKSYKTYQEVNSGVGMIFTTTLFNGVISFTGTLPITSAERPVFYRERASQTYNCLWYFMGSTVAELPYVFLSSGLFTIIFYPWVGFTNHASGVMYWIVMSLFGLMQTYLGQLFIYALPSVEVAAILGVLYNSICLLFAGFNPPAASIPAGYHWLYVITPQKYIMGILNALAFTDCSNDPVWNDALNVYENGGSELACRQLEDAPVTLGHTTVKAYIEDHFYMKHSEIWSNFGYVFVFLAVFRLLALLSLRFINHQQR
ncbi:ABC transporter, partial [Phytophthora megakarya]